MREIEIKQAIENVREICDKHKVPITNYGDDEEFPNGSQGSDNVISIECSRRFDLSDDNKQLIFSVTYYPWIRVMPNELSIEEFDKILKQGERVKECVIELNEFFNEHTIYKNVV